MTTKFFKNSELDALGKTNLYRCRGLKILAKHGGNDAEIAKDLIFNRTMDVVARANKRGLISGGGRHNPGIIKSIRIILKSVLKTDKVKHIIKNELDSDKPAKNFGERLKRVMVAIAVHVNKYADLYGIGASILGVIIMALTSIVARRLKQKLMMADIASASITPVAQPSPALQSEISSAQNIIETTTSVPEKIADTTISTADMTQVPPIQNVQPQYPTKSDLIRNMTMRVDEPKIDIYRNLYDHYRPQIQIPDLHLREKVNSLATWVMGIFDRGIKNITGSTFRDNLKKITPKSAREIAKLKNVDDSLSAARTHIIDYNKLAPRSRSTKPEIQLKHEASRHSTSADLTKNLKTLTFSDYGNLEKMEGILKSDELLRVSKRGTNLNKPKVVVRGGSKFDDKPTDLVNNVDIEKKHITWFMRDELLKDWPRDRRWHVAILNLDTSEGQGTHWTVIVVSLVMKYLYYFDGLKNFYDTPMEVIELSRQMNLKLVTNKYSIQPAKSNLCGYIAIRFAKQAKRMMKINNGRVSVKLLQNYADKVFGKHPSDEKMTALMKWSDSNNIK